MDSSTLILTLLGFGYLFLVITLANRVAATGQGGRALRTLLYGLLASTFFLALQTAVIGSIPDDSTNPARTPAPRSTPTFEPDDDSFYIAYTPETASDHASLAQTTPDVPTPDLPALPPVDSTSALLNLGFAAAAVALSLGVMHSADVRAWLGRRLRPAGTFHGSSPVHVSALILMLVITSVNFSLFIIGGGLTGLAESLETQSYSFTDVAFNQLLWVAVAVLGVGLFVRRQVSEAMQRLGLRLPTAGDLFWGAAVGIASLVLLFVLSAAIAAFTSPEQAEAQRAASEQIVSALSDSVGAALLGTLLVAIGEEIFFRGAIQPVFGTLVSSLFFVLLHTQYLISPTTLVLFLISLLFGWVRRRHSTTASIIAHFVYNFAQIALVLLAASALERAS